MSKGILLASLLLNQKRSTQCRARKKDEVMKMFRNRQEAGKRLAEKLLERSWQNPIVLALPRGGVPVAAEVANALHTPFDVFVVRKIGVPWNSEYGIGAISETGALWLNGDALAQLALSASDLKSIVEEERIEITRRLKIYRDSRPLPSLIGRTVILVDDGLATGGTALMAIRALRENGASLVVLAVPVGSEDAVSLLNREADLVICLETPADFYAVGQWFHDFHQVSDAEVIEILSRSCAQNSTTTPVSQAL